MHKIYQSSLLSACLLLTMCGVSTHSSQASAVTDSLVKSQAEAHSVASSRKVSIKQKTSILAQSAAKRVKVFFPNPKKGGALDRVESVWRTTSNPGLAQFAIEQLIAGPSSQEKARGLVNPIQFRGSSNCGKNFTLSMNNGVARLQFCKPVVSAGIGDDARVKSSIQATLKQFSSVKSVIILDNQGNCLGDQSGDNLCLKR